MKSIQWLRVVLALGGVGSVYGANLVANPGFEANPIFPSLFTTLSKGDTSSLPGWIINGSFCANCISIVDTTYTEASNVGILHFFSHSGNQFVDLTAGGTSFASDAQQGVSLVPGSYRLSFWLGNMDNAASNYSGASIVQVMIQGACGANPTTFVNDNSTSGQINWQQFSMDFGCADFGGIPGVIDFVNVTVGDHLVGLDDVSVIALPEPTTFVVTALGLVAAALLKIFRDHRNPRLKARAAFSRT
jgi:hypothetical protein